MLQSAHHSTLAAYPSYLLSPGDSLVIPFGCAPIVAGVCFTNGKVTIPVRKPGKKASPDEHASYMVHTPFSVEADVKHPEEVKVAVLASLFSAMHRIPPAPRTPSRRGGRP